jgi:hypothetical protein
MSDVSRKSSTMRSTCTSNNHALFCLEQGSQQTSSGYPQELEGG